MACLQQVFNARNQMQALPYEPTITRRRRPFNIMIAERQQVVVQHERFCSHETSKTFAWLFQSKKLPMHEKSPKHFK